MTVEKNQAGEIEVQKVLQGEADPTQPADRSRRQFGKSGLAASGVILTLASRPVLGGMVCKSPSGFLSGNQSTHGTPPICQGRSPSYWHECDGGRWPMPNSTPFKNVFACSPSSPYKKYTLLQLLSHCDDDPNRLGMYLVSAILNCRQGWTPFLKEDTIKSMFTEWQSSGFFSPTATVFWDASQIVNYLAATQA